MEKCPICDASANYKFTTKYAKVHGCTRRTCGHFFVVDPKSDMSLCDYSEQEYATAFIERNQVLVGYLESNEILREKGSVLDYGSGEGHIAEAFHAKGYEVLCVEPATDAQEVLRKRSLTFVSDISEIEERDFDLVNLIEVIEHIPDPTSVLESLGNLLSTSGRVLITTPSALSLKAKIDRNNSNSFGIDSHIHFFTKNSLQLCLQRAGYKNIECVYLPFMVPNRGRVKSAIAAGLHYLGLGSGMAVIASK